ncbi:dynactin 62 kDa subunit [Cavenderia fasciculata]|uniref:Dynactin subunit 4 n=1 Tax=Cavenderia fasciculata TaxID=261658 RepID=F4Q975_CACFS|nr:dynactin 62 kDa subunit [Cavenderia fasciculata]EGG15244.1 dynactin 62 kDa subunit [Cavenderia fasciculata]|eukprot:XP_004351964.1 dynactin 62 kDa subunit [Cavenderia fasciculata]
MGERNKQQVHSKQAYFFVICVCSKSFNLTELYFCNGCQKLNCKHCVTEQIDCYYCPNCLDHVSVAEASQNGNRCKKCYDCPLCFSVLALQQQQSTTEGGTSSLFLYCNFCKWNSFGMDNSKYDTLSILSGGTKGKELSPMQLEANKVLDVLQKEAADIASSKDSRTLTRLKLAQAMRQLFSPTNAGGSGSGGSGSGGGGGSGYSLNSSALGYSSSLANNFIRDERWNKNRSVASPQPSNPLLPSPSSSSSSASSTSSSSSTSNHLLSKMAIKKRINPIGHQEVDQMMQGRVEARQFQPIVSDDVKQDMEEVDALLAIDNANKINGLGQRFANQQQGPLLSNAKQEQLAPQHKQLLTRRSKRCRRCDKLLAKPDINPAKTEFKRQHFAFSYVPRVVVSRAIWLEKDVCNVQIQFTNPLHSYLFICFFKQVKDSDNTLQIYGSKDDNAIPIEMLTETYIGGILDETDDKDNQALQQLKDAEISMHSRFVIDRKDNKVTLGFLVRVSKDDAPTLDNDEIRSRLATPSTPTKKQDLPKYESSVTNVKFTLALSFSSNSSILNNLVVPQPTSPSSTSSLIHILFDIPVQEFDNTKHRPI